MVVALLKPSSGVGSLGSREHLNVIRWCLTTSNSTSRRNIAVA